ncbi:MAG: sulfite exporter TauE/SafE family protein [Gammaproteobacteria bacterium]|nr:sulfite exporter TauE/SafE family protein [Gammaproteobacteria bacterium]
MDLFAAFLLGLFSAPHCLAMCGGVASALLLGSNAADERAARRPTPIVSALWFGTGKLLGYGALGALAGLTGAVLSSSGTAAGAALHLLAGLLMIGLGLYMTGWWLGIRRLEALGGRLWQPVLRLLRGLQLGRTGNKLAAGLLWGLLPCGIVYSMLALALSAGSAVAGAAIMLSFGLGTLPFVLGSGGVLLAAVPLLRQQRWRTTAGIGLILYGAYGIATTLIP